jgi:hypothetical protein
MSTRPSSRTACLLLLLLALSAGAARAAAPTRGARSDGRALTAAQRAYALRVDTHLRATSEPTVLPFVASRASIEIAAPMVSACESTDTLAADGRAAIRSPLPRSPPIVA